MAVRRHFVALDGLRGVAALSVVVRHLGESFPQFGFVSRSQLAVDFFFMLSGFVIGYAYDAKLRAGMSFGRFAAIRAVRLYPMVLFGVALGVVSRFGDNAAGHGTTAILGAAFFAALMLPTPRSSAVPVSAFPLNGPLWSLTFELLSNLVYAALAPRLTTRFLLVFAGLTALALAWASLRNGGLTFGMAWAPVSLLALVRVFCPFTIGLLLFRCAGHFAPASNLFSLLSAALLIAVLWAPVADGGVYDAFAVLVLFPAIILMAMRSPDEGPLRSGWWWLGAISYPIYAINQPIFRMAEQLDGGAVAGIAGLVLCVVAAFLVRQFYDEPVRRWLGERWLHRRSSAALEVGDDKRGAAM